MAFLLDPAKYCNDAEMSRSLFNLAVVRTAPAEFYRRLPNSITALPQEFAMLLVSNTMSI
jgi:hypothetical protein